MAINIEPSCKLKVGDEARISATSKSGTVSKISKEEVVIITNEGEAKCRPHECYKLSLEESPIESE